MAPGTQMLFIDLVTFFMFIGAISTMYFVDQEQ